MFYTYNRGLPEALSQERFSADLIAQIENELRASGITASDSFIPAIEENWRFYLAQKDRADRTTPSDARKAIKNASDKLDEAKAAIGDVYQLLIHSVNEITIKLKWEATFNEIEQKLAEGMNSVGLDSRTPKNIDAVLLAKNIGRSLDEHTNNHRTTTEGGTWENIVTMLLEEAKEQPTNMHRIILEADKQLKLVDRMLGAVNNEK